MGPLSTVDQDFRALHSLIAGCAHCADIFDTTKEPRRLDATPRKSRLFLVAQALGAKTQLLTGVPFFDLRGQLSATGERLEDFLGQIGFSLRPERPVRVAEGEIGPLPSGMRQAYNSELIQCFPGKKRSGKGDAVPREAVRRCLGQRYLLNEIALVDPRVILLVGSCAFKYFIKEVKQVASIPGTVTKVLERIDSGGTLPVIKVAGQDRTVVPIIHPSGLTTARFKKHVRQNISLIAGLERALR